MLCSENTKKEIINKLEKGNHTNLGGETMRYFVYTLHQISDLEQDIKKGETDDVFQVVLLKGEHIKRFTWTLLNEDINFERKPLGSGIAIFYVDKTVSFFTPKKTKVKK